MIKSVSLLLVIVLAASALIQVDTKRSRYIDEFGRERIFHGINAAPWYPDPEGFDPNMSLSDVDADNLRSWGFNVVRLGMMWPGVEPERKQYNYTYLATMKKIVDNLYSRGIYTILDMHQDDFNRRYCGEGVPDWATVPGEYTLPFPLPIAAEMQTDPVTNYPNITQCLERNFAEYYFANQVADAFENLYKNVGGIQDDFIEFWGVVSAYFNGTEGVLGYELINEPFMGDYIYNPSVLYPEYTDVNFLMPMYEKIHQKIRMNDDTKIIFFEKAVLPAASGFRGGPGGPDYNDRQAFAYHIYCGPTSRDGTPSWLNECEALDGFFYDEIDIDLNRTKLAGFMTEFGAVPDNATSMDSIRYLMEAADARAQSWAYWQLKYYNDITTAGSGESLYDTEGKIEPRKLRELTRTFAPAVQGQVENIHFDSSTGIFSLQFLSNGNITRPTEIYLNEDIYYPKGFTVDVKPGGIVKSEGRNRIQLMMRTSERVLVRISPNL
ncbi:hypothetical protein PROFUN_03946 [Planoprotostelium fungivorum]|uniref:Endoglycoceramidase n=1 Tax=Planoprotostelium fungivorum TaxID=1890364 RepID=A0A2P6MTS4_9EUKA|nr:hypothetical protein PROFUN_03946 [Planoprotostelium fungivorum]